MSAKQSKRVREAVEQTEQKALAIISSFLFHMKSELLSLGMPEDEVLQLIQRATDASNAKRN